MPIRVDSDGLLRFEPDADGFRSSNPASELADPDGFIGRDKVEPLARPTGLTPARFLAATFRYGIPLAGGLGAGAITANPIAGVAAGAALGATGEAAAQLVEQASGDRPEGQNLREIATAGAVGALPFGRATQALRAGRFAQGVTSKAAATLSGAIEGGLFGATSSALKAGIEEERLPTGSELTTGAAGGALLGGVFGRITEPKVPPLTQQQIATEGLEAVAKRAAVGIDPISKEVVDDMLATAQKDVDKLGPADTFSSVSKAFLDEVTGKIKEIPHWRQLMYNTDAFKGRGAAGEPWVGYAAIELAKKAGIVGDDVLSTLQANLGDTALESSVKQLGSGLSTFAKLTLKGDVVSPVDPDILTPAHKRKLGTGLWGLARGIENTRRGVIVQQAASRIVDTMSTTGRAGLDLADTAFQSVLRGQPNLAKSVSQNILARTADVLTKRGIKSTDALMKQFPEIGEGLMDTALMQESKVGGLGRKVVNVARVANLGMGEVMEKAWRKWNYHAALTDGLLRLGIGPDEVRGMIRQLGEDAAPLIQRDPRIKEVLTNSITHALENSFAAPPTGETLKMFTRMFQNNPIATAIIPFPRFIANSTKFLTDFNPIGLFKLLAQQGDGQLLASDPRAVEQVLSRLTIGTAMLSTALASRYSDTAGDRWYEFKLPNGQVLDLQFFAPFSSYLFLAEAIKQMGETGDLGRMTTEDILTGALSFNRVSGIGSFLFDFLQGRTDADSLTPKLEEAIGDYLSGFTVPFRTFKDFLSLPLPEEAETKDVRDRPITGKLIANIPFATRGVAPRFDPLTGQTKKSGGEAVDPLGLLGREVPPGFIRQVTGARIRREEPVASAVTQLGREPFEFTPKLKAPPADAAEVGFDSPALQRRTEQVRGQLTAKRVADLVQSERFQLLPPEERSAVLLQLMSRISREADRQALNEARRRDPKVMDRIRLAQQGSKLPTSRQDKLRLEQSQRRLGLETR